MTIGVILVSYNTGVALLNSLDALLVSARAPGAPAMRVLVVDNASPDGTEARLASWATAHGLRLDRHAQMAGGYPHALDLARDGTVGFLQAGSNGGFAAGVNHGLRTFRAIADVDYFWILNSDAMTAPQTPAVLVKQARILEASGGFGILGGRVLYADPPGVVQSDGGRIDWQFGRILHNTFGLAEASATDAAALPPALTNASTLLVTTSNPLTS